MLAYYKLTDLASKAEQYFWAYSCMYELGAHAPELVWETILISLPKFEKLIEYGMWAAGPLEDLIADYGEQFYDRIEEQWHQSREFKLLLSGVWPLGNEDTEVWKKISTLQQNGPSKY